MENKILIVEAGDNDYEIHLVSEEGSKLAYKCRGYDSAIDTAKVFRKEKAPDVAVWKKGLADEEEIKVLG